MEDKTGRDKILDVIARTASMSLSASANLFREFNYNSIFVETGTYKCGGIFAALSAGFKTVHSIEANLGYYNRALAKYSGHTGVHLWHGDSSKILWEVIKDIEQSITFWLDSHHFDQSQPENAKRVPLLDELAIIAKHPIKTHTILIDDRRLLGATTEKACPEWAELTEEVVRYVIFSINPDYKISYRDTKQGKQDAIVCSL